MSDVIAAKTPTARSRLWLLTLIGLFLAPVIIAWLVFYVFPEWQPTGTINHGELVKPVRPLPAFNMTSLDGKSLDETFLRGKWTFVSLVQEGCDEVCVQQLYTIRQIRLTQGKNIDRLQRLLFWRDAAQADAALNSVQQKFPGQVIVPLHGKYVHSIPEVFQIDGTNPLKSNAYYLVDPLGNLMMRYSGDSAPGGVIKDLQRLLKYSGLG